MGFYSKLKKAFLAAIMLAFPFVMLAQSEGISGVVVDENGEPYIGASVMVRGSTIATISDLDGKFSLDIEGNATLVISYIGCETQNVVAYQGQPVTVVLKQDALSLDAGEVVAVGYGTQKKESVVGAISAIKPQELQVPVRSLSQSLAGNIAGLVVDAAVGDSIIASSDGKLVKANFTFDSEEALFGKSAVLKKGSADLLAEVNKVIEAAVADGSYINAYNEAVALQKELGL